MAIDTAAPAPSPPPVPMSEPSLPTARVRVRLPLCDRWRLRFVADDGSWMGEVDLVWTTASRWAKLEASRSGRWLGRRIGPFVVAVRLVTA